eukprot:257184_1
MAMFISTFGAEFTTTYTEPWSETDSWLYFLFYAIATVLSLIILIFHTIHFCSDLYSKDRKALSHRRQKPSLTFKYKTINYLSNICIFLIFFFLLVCTIQMTDSNYKQCVITTYFWTYPWVISRAILYCIFFLRLDMVYAQSAYGYNKYFLYGLMISVCIISFTLGTILIFHMDESLFLTDHDSLPNPCFVYYPNWGYASFLVYDFTTNILSLILFIIPLRKAIKAMANSDSFNAKRPSYKMIYIGIKLTIISTTCVSTTIFALSLASSGYLGYMLCVDHVVNCTCVALMTPYYPDHLYYQRLCCLCLLCCPKKYRGQSNVQSNNKKITRDYVQLKDDETL